MDIIIETIKSKRNVSESTLKSYGRHILKVMKLIDTENITELDDAEKVIDTLENSGASHSSIHAYLASLVVYMDAIEKPDIAKIYRTRMLEYIKKQKEKNDTHEKTDTQKENWATMEELSNVIKNYEKQIKNQKIMKKDTLTKKEKEMLQCYAVAMLYCGDPANHPAVRLDYSPMMKISEKEYNEKKEKDELPSGMNFLVVKSRNKKQFAFHNYKTIKTYGIKMVPLSTKINSVVNKLMKFNKTDFLFENNLGRPMTSNALGKLLTKAFENTGKSITVNMIRHIYISEQHPVEAMKQSQKNAELMLHSPSTQKIYAKE